MFATGGNRGIGLASARAFTELGDRVAVTCHSSEPPQTLTDAGCLAIRCDITDPNHVESAYQQIEERHGPVEVLVANAGITWDTLLTRMSEEDLSTVLDTNLTAVYRTVQQAAHGMLRAGKGRIVLVSSVVALQGAAGQANYAAAKAALIGLVRELGSRNITCNVIAPGLVDTGMTDALSAGRRTALLSQIPLARSAHPDETAAAIRFLASDQASYITGAIIPVDGGSGLGR
ncbi:SDR family oxidoreductase [Streptomyces griseoviridis]|uniref:SDR family oxidoreductase n=1 Tax=Streptomyces griseoviridis TaxID=45398 RepID=UPI00344B6C4F